MSDTGCQFCNGSGWVSLGKPCVSVACPQVQDFLFWEGVLARCGQTVTDAFDRQFFADTEEGPR